MGGPHPRSPPRVHRLGHLPGQPGTGSAATSARRPASRAPARSARAARCCRAWPPAGHAAANWPSSTAARPNRSRLLLPGRRPTWSTAAAPGTCSTGGQAIDAAVAAAFLAALAPGRAARAACRPPTSSKHGHDAALDQHRRQVEQARYDAARAERRYRAVDPDNRLVARGLEAEWETRCSELADAEAELARRETARPKALTAGERTAILALGDDLGQVWDAPTTTDKDRKQLLRTLLDEVNITAPPRRPGPARRLLILRWKGGAISELTVPLRRPSRRSAPTRTPSTSSAGWPSTTPTRSSPASSTGSTARTARGMSYTANRVQSLRHHWKIPCHQPGAGDRTGRRTAQRGRRRPPSSDIAPSTLLRWLNDGFVAGEQITPGAPWRIRLTDELRGMLTDNAPDGWLAPRRQPRARRLPPDRIAEGQARRAQRRPDPHRTQERPAYRATDPARRPVLDHTISKGAV